MATKWQLIKALNTFNLWLSWKRTANLSYEALWPPLTRMIYEVFYYSIVLYKIYASTFGRLTVFYFILIEFCHKLLILILDNVF